MKLLKTVKGNEVAVFEGNDEMMKIMKSAQYVYRGKDFLGEELRSHDEVEKRFNRNWAAALYDVEQCRKKINEFELPELRSRKRKRHYNSEEGDIDVERLLEGSDNFREATKRQSKEGNSEVTIVVDIVAPHFENSESIFWRGAAGLVIADKLNDAGYSVELWNIASIGRGFTDTDKKIAMAAVLKRCSDPFDLSSLCNAMGGWYFRAAMIHVLDALGKHFKRPVCYHHGYATMASPDMIDVITNDEDCFYIAGINSFDGALNIVISTLEKIKAAHERFSQDLDD